MFRVPRGCGGIQCEMELLIEFIIKFLRRLPLAAIRPVFGGSKKASCVHGSLKVVILGLPWLAITP